MEGASLETTDDCPTNQLITQNLDPLSPTSNYGYSQLDIVHCPLLGLGTSEYVWREGGFHVTEELTKRQTAGQDLSNDAETTARR